MTASGHYSFILPCSTREEVNVFFLKHGGFLFVKMLIYFEDNLRGRGYLSRYYVMFRPHEKSVC